MDDPPVDGDDEARLRRLGNDPNVIVRRRRTDKPFVSQIRILSHVAVLDLLNRCRNENAANDDAARP